MDFWADLIVVLDLDELEEGLLVLFPDLVLVPAVITMLTPSTHRRTSGIWVWMLTRAGRLGSD